MAKSFRWLAPFVWMGLIFWESSQSSLPTVPEPVLELLVKKSGHMLIFGILAVLWWRALDTVPSLRPRALWWALGLTIAYAVADEWHQTFVPGRHGNMVDVLIDSAGATLILQAWLRVRSRSLARRLTEPTPQR